MKTHVQFRSDKFPSYDGEEEQINPGLWGKRLADYLGQKLNSLGIETKKIIPEDWGWRIPIENNRFPLFVGCGHQTGDTDEFLCFIIPGKPTMRKWFRDFDSTEAVGRIAEALDEILTSDPDIREVRWQAQ